MSKSAFLLSLVLTIAIAAIFAIWPQLDLAAARALRGPDGFIGTQNAARMLRSILYWLPAGVLALMAFAWVAARVGTRLSKHLVPGGKSLIFLLLGFALGPGLLVNVGLKEHSARPRPAQVKDFGGAADFRPWHSFDGACRRNCSFVSGEVAASAWLVAPASLAPPPFRAPAIAAALAVTAATAILRMAFGGHFLSDVLFAALFTLLVCQLLHMLVFRRRSADR